VESARLIDSGYVSQPPRRVRSPSRESPAAAHNHDDGTAARRTTGHVTYFFGPFRVIIDGQPLREATWRRSSAKTLLKWLLLSPGEPFSADCLWSMLWPDLAANRAARNLSVTLHCLRHLLEPQLPARQASMFIRSDNHKNYWFDLAGIWHTDVEEAWDLQDIGRKAERQGDLLQAVDAYQRVVTIYSKSFLPEDVYDDCFVDHRHDHDVAHIRAAGQLMKLYLRTDQLSKALFSAISALARDPFDRDAVITVVEVYSRQGNITGAIRQVDELIRRSRHEFGTIDDPELLALRAALLRAG